MKKLIAMTAQVALVGLLFMFVSCFSSSDEVDNGGRGGKKGDYVTVVGKISFYPPITQDMSEQSSRYGKVYAILKGKDGGSAVVEGTFGNYFSAKVERKEFALDAVTTTIAAWKGGRKDARFNVKSRPLKFEGKESVYYIGDIVFAYEGGGKYGVTIKDSYAKVLSFYNGKPGKALLELTDSNVELKLIDR